MRPPTPTSRCRAPANRSSIDFPITTLDNFVQGDTAVVTIEAYPIDPVDLSSLVPPGGSTNLTVQDNDSPTLIVTLDRGVVAENAAPPAAHGTVRRNTLDNSQPLVVQLVSSDPGEALPATTSATIPALADSVGFDLNAVDDFTPDGNQIVTITATSSGFNTGYARLVVSDIDKPDLRITSVSAPTAGRTDQPIDELMSSLLQILRNISIKTLQIAMPTATSRASMPIQPAVSGQHSQLKPAELAKAERPLTQPADPQLTQAGSPDRQQQSLPMRPFAPAMAAGLEPRDELDQLVDDLESLDL